jgi:2-aminoadipate transaminase
MRGVFRQAPRGDVVMFAKRIDRVTRSATMELIKTTAGKGYLSFAGGLPDPRLFPVEELRAITADVLERDGAAALQYGAAEGYEPLREVAAEILTGRGLATHSEQILITCGSQQGLDLAARALLDPGDIVVIESPSYLAAIQAFDSYGVRYATVPLDPGGMEPAAAEAALAAGAKLVYALPNFQNPTGITLDGGRRVRIAEAAARSGAALIEDDAYYDLRYEGPSLTPLCALADNPWSVYLGTFSKSIAPGVRVGYVRAAVPLIERLAQLKQITDLHSGSLTQRVVNEYCRRGLLEPGIARFRQAYAARRDAMLAALETAMPPAVTWTQPNGGMFLFVTLPETLEAETLLQQAMAQGVVFVPGRTFHPDGRGGNTLRLNFVSEDESRIREGMRRMGQLLREGLSG